MESYILNPVRRVGFMTVFIAGLVYAGSLPAAANGVQSLASLRLQVESFILQYPYASPYPPRFELGNLIPGCGLKACPKALAVEFARADRTMGNTSTPLVRCPVKSSWKIHLPARIAVFDDIVVTAHALVKGQIIDETTAVFRKRDIARLKNGYFTRQSALMDLQARRNLPQGTVLTSGNLNPRLPVKSGQRVTLVLNYKGLQVKSTGQAPQSASRGQLVRVRNSQSLKIVEGVVTGDALVQVGIVKTKLETAVNFFAQLPITCTGNIEETGDDRSD